MESEQESESDVSHRAVERGVMLSLVIASRNDHHQGNSVLRLETALNFAGESVAEAGRIGEVELMVCDWGSKKPLSEVLVLNKNGRTVTRFVEVGPDLASAWQKDSPFPEVLALNIAIRRCRGALIGRIDQDTLVTADFVVTCFDRCHVSTPDLEWPGGFAFLRRCSLPFAVCRREPGPEFLRRVIDRLGRWIPQDGPHASPWFDAPVGVVLMPRKLWFTMRGYDERLLYWGWMETDLGFRVGLERPAIDLAEHGFMPLYHLEHVAWRLPFVPRRKNSRLIPVVSAPGKQDWGLAGVDLKVANARDCRSDPAEAQTESGWLWGLVLLSLPGMWAMNGILRGYKFVRSAMGWPRYAPALKNEAPRGEGRS